MANLEPFALNSLPFVSLEKNFDTSEPLCLKTSGANPKRNYFIQLKIFSLKLQGFLCDNAIRQPFCYSHFAVVVLELPFRNREVDALRICQTAVSFTIF